MFQSLPLHNAELYRLRLDNLYLTYAVQLDDKLKIENVGGVREYINKRIH